MGKERRRYMRLSTDKTLDCAIDGMEVLHIVGLGSEGSGMRIITNHELPDGDFGMTVDPNDGQPPISLKARAVWQESWDFEICNRNVAGIAFVEVPDGARERLQALLPAEPTGEPDSDL